MPSKAKPKQQAKKSRATRSTAAAKREAPASIKKGAPRGDFDASRQRRRLAKWTPTAASLNTILTSAGELLRARARDTLRNNALAVAASESFVSNLIGAGIKPSPINSDAALRKEMNLLWGDWSDECDADGLTDFYGLQSMAARAIFEAGEVFVRFRPRLAEDGLSVPLQLQLLESEMVPFNLNERAPNGNYIMNGVEFDFRGRRAAYWMHPIHPGDMAIEPDAVFGSRFVRIPASEVLHVFCATRPGQVRGVPLVTPALVRLFLLDQYDDAELDRKKTAAMYAGFITAQSPDDFVPEMSAEDANLLADNDGPLASLEPGTMQTLLPGESVEFSEPADVGGAYEMFQYRQQLAVFGAMGVPYALATSDLKRSNYSSLRGAIVEYRRRLEQRQFNTIIPMLCQPIRRRWMREAVLSGALAIKDFVGKEREYSRTKWIAPRFEWVDPLKDRQAEKLAVDAGFKSRSDVIEAEGYDPEETDARIKADKEREEKLGLSFAVGGAKGKVAAPNDPNAADDNNDAGDADEDGADNDNDAADAA